ncbi:MAG: glycerol-3-phosphate dehydrogenase/oxidase [Gammaproteobacteria bacterium]|nr:glycerol-3-phosphate dehydrogenase/oxidase [Gammaproteobacteria bacterium]MBU1777621.1 glycerol-3-phosphate dehydrogenase/oxidase [Gammaproteobacteria bacterium]MBU1969472.1 glycerol-3-phosphate dehydrogenase/oxidase [Gammaproteobacteria bacterium]
MKRNFSALQDDFDLLVCGGGIYGAWTAYDAVLRGLKVALVEQGDWASATSCSSSKLIHGGLRYLETFDFKLVRKALKERQMLLHIAPHRVWPLRFGVPVYADSRNGMLKLKAGLTLYDTLAGFPGEPMRHHHFLKQEFSGRFPFLHDADLKGGFTYGDAQTDDARLVLELVAGAIGHGAVCVNYARLLEWNEEDGKVCGATVQDGVGGDTVSVNARQCVSSAGPWTAATAQGRAWCRLSKGIHLVLPALPAQEAVLLTTKADGRVFFMIPWYGRTLLGTTDTDYRGAIDHVAVDAEEVDYLLAAANDYLKTAWTRADVIGSYAGLRAMRQSDAAHPSSVSRDWELKTAANGVLHVVGGKLTSSREDAAVIVDRVCAQLGLDTVCATQDRRLPWKPQQDFSAWTTAMTEEAQRLGIDAESVGWLLRRHGERAVQVFRIVEDTPQLAARIMSDLPFIHADLVFCAGDEMVQHLSDLLRRRMPLLILAKLDAQALSRLAELVAPQLGWDPERRAREVEACGK